MHQVTPTVGGCPSTRKEGPLATPRGAGIPEGQGAPVCTQGCTLTPGHILGPGPRDTHSSRQPIHHILPGPIPHGPCHGLSRASYHQPHQGVGLRQATRAHHPLSSTTPGRQCREGKAQTERGRGFCSQGSGQAWRSEGELLPAQALPRETWVGLGVGT